MSEDKRVSDEQEQGSATEEQYVPRKAYEEVSRDMHKYKQTAREAEAARTEYEAKLKQLEEEKMKEQAQWKELAEKREQELELARKEANETKSRFSSAVKKSALKQELGGSIRDEYLSFANIDSIELNDDGSLNMESLRNVANKFREEHGSLIPPAKPDSTSKAAPTGQTVSQGKSIDELSGAEAFELLSRMK